MPSAAPCSSWETDWDREARERWAQDRIPERTERDRDQEPRDRLHVPERCVADAERDEPPNHELGPPKRFTNRPIRPP